LTAQVGNLGLKKYGVFFKAGNSNICDGAVGLEHNIILAVTAGFKQKNNPPLGGALGTADAVLGTQLVDITGHLALQKFAAVWPAQLNMSPWVYRFAHCPPAV
jgi:hypothetical protein